MQEDKEGFFDTYDTLLATLKVFSDMLSGLNVNTSAMREAAEGGQLLATDIADYLVAKGMPFRDAYRVVARLSESASQKGLGFADIPLEEYRDHSELFDADVYDITIDSSIAARDVPGGTAHNRVREAIQQAKRQSGARQ